eukprot:jgi/Hompol1/1241/HPOL_003109-RA
MASLMPIACYHRHPPRYIANTHYSSYSQDYLGSPLFYPSYKQSIEDAIRTSNRVRTLIDELTDEQWALQTQSTGIQDPPFKGYMAATKDQVRKKLEAQTHRIVQSMVADMGSDRFVRFFAFVVRNMLARMYHRGIHIRENEIERGLSLVFLPCHKSHIDYLVVSYVLYRLGFALPHIAAGDNLNLPLVGWILRHNGAFFMRRQWGDDRLYGMIMKVYIETLLQRGHNIEAFIEGTRSRTGKLLQPKFGILKILMDAVRSGRVQDLIVVPVSIGYDKVIETPSYTDELLGMPKQKESLFQLLNSVNILQFKFGRIDVRFGEPFSLREYIQAESLRRGFSLAPSNRTMVDEMTLLLQSLGYRVLGDINKISVVMPTALVGTTLLTLRGRGLIRKVGWIRAEILAKGGQVAEFGSTSLSEIVDRAIQVLGDLIGRRGDLLEPVYHPLKRFELSYYRNQIMHLEPVAPNNLQWVTLSAEERRIGRETFDFYCFLLWPFVETYWLAAVSMYTILPDPESCEAAAGGLQWVDERIFLKRCQFFGRTLYYEGDLSYFEAINRDTLANAIARLREMGVIQIRKGQHPSGATASTVSAASGGRTLGTDRKSATSALPTSVQAATSWVALSLPWVPKTEFPKMDLEQAHNIESFTVAQAAEAATATGQSAHSNHGDEKSNGKFVAPQWDGPLTGFPTWPPSSSDRQSVALQTPHVSAEQETSSSGHKTAEPEPNQQQQHIPSPSPSPSPSKVAPADDLDSWYRIKPSGRLWDLCESIGRYRREGKNRRDTNTVAIRVLRLARLASLWHDGKSPISTKQPAVSKSD